MNIYDDRLADGLDLLDERRRAHMMTLRDEDGNWLYECGEDDAETVECECGIIWEANEMVDGLCPECRSER